MPVCAMIVLMDLLFVYVLLGAIGLIMGSFAGASVWRLRAHQLAEDKAAGEEVETTEYKKLSPLTKTTLFNDRSVCLHCGHTLAWYDLIPLFSWLSTGGKCRYCRQKIGWFEPVIELATALVFLLSFLFWPFLITTPLETTRFVLWLVAVVLLVILFAYDLKWYLLPNKVVFPLLVVSLAAAVLALSSAHDLAWGILNLCFAILILSGLYFVLWILSKGAWIGFGDVKLGLCLALLLGQWPLAFLALLAANVIGCLIVLPGLITGKVTSQTRVPFGPLLIVGTFIAMLWGSAIVQWYFMTFA